MIHALHSPDAVLDRDCEHRDADGYLAAVQARATHRVLVLHRGQAPIAQQQLLFRDAAAESVSWPDGTLSIYLGKTLPGAATALPAGTELVLKVLPAEADPTAWAPAAGQWLGYRDAAGMLPAAEAAIFIQAAAVANWHVSHTFCPRCGAPTVLEGAGWMRTCSRDGSQHFPRTDPAVIVAIVGDDDRILLANNFAWEPHRFSTVAGFVEGGESAEQAAVREIAEEVGVRLHEVTYVGSQSWPFPRSLMLGFLAATHDAVPVPDGVEVREARWFSRAELQAAIHSGDAVISSRLSIARALIEHWYGGPIADRGERSTPPAGVAAGARA